MAKPTTGADRLKCFEPVAHKIRDQPFRSELSNCFILKLKKLRNSVPSEQWRISCCVFNIKILYNKGIKELEASIRGTAAWLQQPCINA